MQSHIVSEFRPKNISLRLTVPSHILSCSCLPVLSNYNQNTCSPHWKDRSGSYQSQHTAFSKTIPDPKTLSLFPTGKADSCRSDYLFPCCFLLPVLFSSFEEQILLSLRSGSGLPTSQKQIFHTVFIPLNFLRHTPLLNVVYGFVFSCFLIG